MGEPMRSQLLIDTDPGVDDALAILMAHQHGRVCALSVTAGNTGLNHTVRNACTLVDLLASDVPVFAGCSEPLVRVPDEDAVHVHGHDGFGDVGLPTPECKPGDEHAALAMIRMTREQPGKLTLVALAPLTNLALAVRLDPAFPSRVGRLVVMGGAVNGHGNMRRSPVEFNVGFDPEAAHVVFGAFEQFDLVDWELTVRHAFDEAQFDRWMSAGDRRADLLRRISGRSRQYNAERERRGVIAADALAMAVALDPAIVIRAETRHVAVDLDGNLTRGMTVVDWEHRGAGAANARIVLELDHDRFSALVATALGASV